MRRPIAIILILALTGCGVSETVTKRRPRKGPVKEVGWVELGGGEVKYSMDGWGLWVRGRRFSALRRMRRICRPLKAVIIDEFTRQDVQVPYSSEDIQVNVDRGLDHYTVAPYEHIVFECHDKAGKTPNIPRP
jgi:hypothetical protein